MRKRISLLVVASLLLSAVVTFLPAALAVQNGQFETSAGTVVCNAITGKTISVENHSPTAAPVTLSGATDFTVAPDTSLAAGSNTLTITPNVGTAAGTQNTIRLTSDEDATSYIEFIAKYSPMLTFTSTGSAFGSTTTPVAKTYTIVNNSGASATIDIALLSNNNDVFEMRAGTSGAYSKNAITGITLANGQSTTIEVLPNATLASTTPGVQKSATLSLTAGTGFVWSSATSSNVSTLGLTYTYQAATGSMSVAAVNPTGSDSGSFSVVYSAGASAAHQFRITSTRSIAETVNIAVPTNFEVSTNGTTYSSAVTGLSIAANGTQDFWIRAKAGLNVGTYTGSVAVSSGGTVLTGGTIPVSVTVIAQGAALKLYTNSAATNELSSSISFDDDVLGYSPEVLTFYVKNIGNAATNSTITVTSSSSNFAVTSPNAGTLNYGNVSSAATVKPISGLSIGTYNATITVNAGNASTQFNVSFEVKSESGSSNYLSRTLTNSGTGVVVSGTSIHRNATLSVVTGSLHSAGACSACDSIRSYMQQGKTICIHNISLTQGFTGSVNVTIPVGSTYNGKTLTVLHCSGGTLETRNIVAQNGSVTGSFSSLSPFAVLDAQYATITDNTNTIIDPPKSGDGDWHSTLGKLFINFALILAVGAGLLAVFRKRSAA